MASSPNSDLTEPSPSIAANVKAPLLENRDTLPPIPVKRTRRELIDLILVMLTLLWTETARGIVLPTQAEYVSEVSAIIIDLPDSFSLLTVKKTCSLMAAKYSWVTWWLHSVLVDLFRLLHSGTFPLSSNTETSLQAVY